MERLEEYAKDESPFTEQENLPRDLIQEDLITNSEDSGGAESDPNRKISN